MSARWPNIVVWVLAIASAVLWAHVLTSPPHAAKGGPPAGSLVARMPMDLTRLLGADPTPPQAADAAPPVADTRMQLVGVVSSSSDDGEDDSLALIAINGQPAKVYRVGMSVDGDTVLQAIAPRGARLGPRGGATVIALSTTTLAAGAAANELPQPMVPAATSWPVQAIATSPPPTLPATAADGAPPPFGGPPQAIGGAPPTPARGVARPQGSR